jgi:hypothetical protein
VRPQRKPNSLVTSFGEATWGVSLRCRPTIFSRQVQLPAPRFHALHIECSHHVRVVTARMDTRLVALQGITVKAAGSCGMGPRELIARRREQGRTDKTGATKFCHIRTRLVIQAT